MLSLCHVLQAYILHTFYRQMPPCQYTCCKYAYSIGSQRAEKHSSLGDSTRLSCMCCQRQGATCIKEVVVLVLRGRKHDAPLREQPAGCGAAGGCREVGG